MPSSSTVRSNVTAAGVGVTAGLALAFVVAVVLAPPGDVANPLVAVGCFLVAAPPAYVLARAAPGERGPRLLGYLAAWLVAGLLGVSVLYAWFVSMPGMQGVGLGGLLLFVGPGAWVAAAAALRGDPSRLTRFGGVTLVTVALGLAAGHVLQSPLDTYWLPEVGFGAGLVLGLLLGYALVYRFGDRGSVRIRY